MKERNDWVHQFKKIPDWIKGAIGLIITLGGFVVAFRNDPYLYAVLLGLSILIGLLYAFTYIAFARMPASRGRRSAFKFERYRRLAIAGNVILTILTLIILNSTVGRTYLTFAFQGTHPAQFGRLSTTEPGIYVSQIIKDPHLGFPDTTKFAVWLSASGNYYVDSIRVVPACSPYLSAMESGAQPADANYVFT